MAQTLTGLINELYRRHGELAELTKSWPSYSGPDSDADFSTEANVYRAVKGSVYEACAALDAGWAETTPSFCSRAPHVLLYEENHGLLPRRASKAYCPKARTTVLFTATDDNIDNLVCGYCGERVA